MIEPKLRFKADDGSQFPDWEEKKVGSLGNIVGGGTPSTKKKEYWCGKMAWVSSADICDNDIYNINMTRFITQDAIDKSATKIVPKDSILIVSRVGVGKVAKASCDLCTSQDFTNIVNSDGDATFLSYAILRLMQSKLQCVQGTSIKGIPSDEIKNYMLRIPCLAEQQKIAEFLSTIDTVIEKQKETVSAWEERKKGVMQKLFSQEVRFKADDGSDFPEWEEKKLGEVFEFYNGKAHENVISENGKYVVVNSKFISTDGTVRKYTNEMIFPLIKKDIVMVMSDVPNGKAISKCFLINENNKYTLNQRICCLRTKENAAFYIDQISRNKYFLKFDDGVKQTNLRKNDILQCPLLCPCLAEQQKIAVCLSSLDEVIEKQKATLAAWEELKKGLLQQMFV